MKRYLKELVLLLAVFGGLPFDVASDANATPPHPPLRVTGGIQVGTSDTTVYATAYGMNGDGATDNGTAFATALAAVPSGATLLVPAGTYVFTSTFNWTYSNVKVVALGAVTFTTAQQQLLSFTGSGTIQNVTFQGIKFASTYVASGTIVFGIVNAFSQNGSDFAMSNVTFQDCEFTGGGSEGVKLIDQSLTNKTFKDILILRCNFHDLGSMGVETQNHVGDGVQRISNVAVRQSTFKTLGTFGTLYSGVGVSYSGPSTNMDAEDNLFDDCSGIGIEFTDGPGGRIVHNRFRGFTIRNGNTYVPIGIDNNTATTVPAMVVVGNQELEDPGSTAATWNFFYLTNSLVADNVTRGSGIDLFNVQNSLITGNALFSRQAYGVHVESSSINNKITGNILNTTPAASPSSVVRFDGATVTNNEVQNNDIVFSAGVATDQINSATGNVLGLNRINNVATWSSAQTFPSPVTSGTGGTGTVNAATFNPGSTSAVSLGTSLASSVGIGVAGTNTNINGDVLLSQGQRVHRTTVANTAYTIVGEDYYIAYTSIAAARVVSIPCNSLGSTTLPSVQIIKDESGSASGTNTITLTPSSGLIDGAASKVCVNSAFGSCRVISNGTNCYLW